MTLPFYCGTLNLMTKEDHLQLYDELKAVIYTRGYSVENLTEAQTVFVNALEQAAFGADLLKVYAELVEDMPNISLRNLHAFSLGFGLGLSGNVSEIDLTKKYH